MGHSTASGRTGGGGQAAVGAAAAERYEAGRSRIESAIERRSPGLTAISRASFTNEGNGQWTLDVPDQGGGQILDETGSSRDPNAGRGGKLYSARSWNADNDFLEDRAQYFTSLNDAKSYVKSQLQADRRRRSL